MKNIFKNITFLLLIITAISITSCSDVSKSCCEDILNFQYTENDSLASNSLYIAEKCSQKYHKRPDFLQKISQIHYYKAINNYSSPNPLPTIKDFYSALENINAYFHAVNEIKSYDYQYRGEIYERLGDIYRDINSLKPAAELYDKALSDYELSNNNEKYLNTLIKIGKLYQYNHIHNIAMIYFEMAEEKGNIPNNIYRKIIDNKIVTLYELNDYKKADSIFSNHFNIKIQDYDFHSAIGTKLFYERKYEDALPHLKYCFENGNQQEKMSFSEKLAEAYFNLNDHENEMTYIQHQAKNNSIEIRKTPLKLDSDKLFDSNYNIINDIARKENTNNHKITIIFVLIFAIIITIFIVIYSKNRQKQLEKINSAQKIINENKEIISSKDKIIKDISKKLDNIKAEENFEEAYIRFCESHIYKKIKSSFEGITIMTKNVHNYNKLALSSKDLILVTKTFSNCFPKAIPSLKNDFNDLTPGDIKFLILDLMNLNNVEIAVLLGLTYGAANKKNNKIKNIFNIKDNLNTFTFDYIKSNF